MNMITAFSILFATSWDFTYVSFTYIRFYVSVSIRRSHFEIEFGKNSKTYACVLQNSIPPCRNGPPAHVHMTNFHLT